DKELLSKILKNNAGLEYDKELFEFLFSNENEETLKGIIINIYKTFNLKVIIFKDELGALVEKLKNPELKILFLLYIILKVGNIILAIEAINIMKRKMYQEIEISEEMLDIFCICNYVDKKGKIEIEVLEKIISKPELLNN
ncbi:MAG: hypothetical protein ACRDDH_14370, partial [Cetobacterium sp.]|uniref:hypothetical protein n=1 Tax=Cetobacterium sp. TaxID=2071632 RepID=UPI003EE452F4